MTELHNPKNQNLDENSHVNELATIAQKEKTAQLIWTGFILMFFLIQAVLWLVAITVTANDKSHAIVAGYDEKALRWDEEQALRAASSRLGWKAELVVDPASDVRGLHEISIKLSDAEAQPVAGAHFDLTAFHRAYAGEPQLIKLKENQDGVYSGEVVLRKSGFWQFTGKAQSEDDVFFFDERQLVSAGK